MVRYVNIYINIFQKLDQTELAESVNGNYSQHEGKAYCSRYCLYVVLGTAIPKHVLKRFSKTRLKHCHCPFKETL